MKDQMTRREFLGWLRKHPFRAFYAVFFGAESKTAGMPISK